MVVINESSVFKSGLKIIFFVIISMFFGNSKRVVMMNNRI